MAQAKAKIWAWLSELWRIGSTAEGDGGMTLTGEAPSTSIAVPPCAPAASCSAYEPPDAAHHTGTTSLFCGCKRGGE